MGAAHGPATHTHALLESPPHPGSCRPHFKDEGTKEALGGGAQNSVQVGWGRSWG